MKYPVGIQDFRELRSGGYVYVDKTEYIHRMLTSGKYYFLSRPRRFGKSLLLSTIKELYAGSRELFGGLWGADHWDWEQTNPIVWLRFAQLDYQHKGLYQGLREEMVKLGRSLGLDLEGETLKDLFQELIRKAHREYGRKTVLLIDEYDKPIIDYLDDIPKAEGNRETLKNFYSVLKDCDPSLELVFITGVSAFSKVSIFSDLNNLENLTFSPRAYTLLGITPDELERNFSRQLATVDKEQLQDWYNGYSWGGETKVYNPFSILQFFKEGGLFRNFWFETGTPTFLVKEMKKHRYFDVKSIRVSPGKLSAFDFTRLDPVTVLFQTGYLTITAYSEEDRLYTLDYPNREVRNSLEQDLLRDYLDYPLEEPMTRIVAIRDALRRKDIPEVMVILNATFAGIPYDLWHGENEHFFHALVHLTFSLLGAYIQSEVHTSKGRCDALVHTDHFIYALEFKLDGSAEEALQQIKTKDYLAPFADSPKGKIAIGINISSREKKVIEWKMEEMV